ncbi:MAG: hypothetical protein LBR33_10320 [Propionibacteriaceae bacterium]|nr:hypothetical protein [Propionibacteriaceae bacterium]
MTRHPSPRTSPRTSPHSALPAQLSLPHRPRLLLDGPAVWRRPGVLQIGLGSPHVVLQGVPSELAAAIPLLDGRHSQFEVACAVGPRWAHWLLRSLDQFDVLGDGPLTAGRLRVGVVGAGPLADAIAARLAAHGHQLAGGRAGQADVVVVAPATIEPDRVAVNALVKARTPHLVATCGHGRAGLGPFVIPGATSCLMCADLARSQADPAWPLIAFQLSQLFPPADPLLIDWVAAGVSAQVAAWQAGRLPETASTTVTFDRLDAASAWTPWPAHPGCGCTG